MLPGKTYLAALDRTSKHHVLVQANTLSRADEHGNVQTARCRDGASWSSRCHYSAFAAGLVFCCLLLLCSVALVFSFLLGFCPSGGFIPLGFSLEGFPLRVCWAMHPQNCCVFGLQRLFAWFYFWFVFCPLSGCCLCHLTCGV